MCLPSPLLLLNCWLVVVSNTSSGCLCCRVSSVRFRMVSMLSKKSICAPPHLSEVSPTSPLKPIQCSSDSRWPALVLSRKIVWWNTSLAFHASLLLAINGVMSLALCPQVVSQASQHSRSSEKQTTCEGCFARYSGMSMVLLLRL